MQQSKCKTIAGPLETANTAERRAPQHKKLNVTDIPITPSSPTDYLLSCENEKNLHKTLK